MATIRALVQTFKTDGNVWYIIIYNYLHFHTSIVATFKNIQKQLKIVFAQFRYGTVPPETEYGQIKRQTSEN